MCVSGRTVGSCPARLFYDFAVARRDCTFTSSNMVPSRFNGLQFRLVKGFNTSLTHPAALSKARTAQSWGAWKKVPRAEFEVRTGDRYLGGTKWEHYLGFKQHRASTKAIKLFLIRLGREDVRGGGRHPSRVAPRDS